MDCTGQVTKGEGTLFTPLIEAKTPVLPGAFAVATAWFSVSPVTELFSRATLASTAAQVNWPTVLVMSPSVLLNAEAVKVC
jgi:hypothetical protein